MEVIINFLTLRLMTTRIRTNLIFSTLLGFSIVASAQVDTCLSIVCKSNVSFTIKKGEIVHLNPGLFLDDPWCRSIDYSFEYSDSRRKYLIDSIDYQFPEQFDLTVFNYTYGHECKTTVSLHVQNCRELFTPGIGIRTIEIMCGESNSPEDVGLPVPDSAVVVKLPNGEFSVSNWNACEELVLSYYDEVRSGDCESGMEYVLIRRWRFFSDDGRRFEPIDTIKAKLASLADTVQLINYDGIDAPILNCNDSWGMSGFIPSTEVTGAPFDSITNLCSHVGWSHIDTVIESIDLGCYHKRKIVRKFNIWDWCTGDVIEKFQAINVECGGDSIPPTAVCDSLPLLISVPPNGSKEVSAESFVPKSFDDCGIESFSFSLDSLIESQIFFLADSSGYVTIYVRDYFGNIDSCEAAYEVKLSSSANDIHQSEYEVSPNPFTDRLLITAQRDFQSIKIELINAHGKICFAKDMGSMTLGQMVEVSVDPQWSPGLYFLKIEDGRGLIGMNRLLKL